MRRDSEFRLLAPLIALALGAMAVFVVSLIIWAREVDREVQRREEALVRRGVASSAWERSILPEMDGGALASLQERFQLSNLRSSIGRTKVAAGDASISLPMGPGEPELTLSWTPQKPGAEIARAAALPVGLVLLAFGIVGTVMIARIRAAALQFLASHKAQSDFLANMSHEIRTPLNGVNAIAAALRRTPLDKNQAELVGIIEGSGETLERLLSDLLDLSRIETGTVKVSSQPFHLADAVRSVAAVARTRADEKALDLIVDIDPAAETSVAGDAVRVKQVLLNLVANAVKFTSEGYVAIAVRAEGEDGWRIDVQDTGIGFDPAEKDRLFSRFQQGDASATRRYGGAGLGLTIAKQLVDLMGGQINAVGAPGEGATFTIRLPLAITAAPPAEAPAPHAAPDRPLRILLADDHPTNRKVVQVLFSEFDVDLICVENGEQACEAFARQRFDLVLMDMQMPVMDGLTAVRSIRERERLRSLSRTPIVMLTASALPEHEAASAAAGADLHMPKPVEASKLFGVLQTIAERQSIAAAA